MKKILSLSFLLAVIGLAVSCLKTDVPDPDDPTPSQVMMSFVFCYTEDMLDNCDIQVTLDNGDGSKTFSVTKEMVDDKLRMECLLESEGLPATLTVSRKVTLKKDISSLNAFTYTKGHSYQYALYNESGNQVFLSEIISAFGHSTGTGAHVATLINEGRLNQVFTFRFNSQGKLVEDEDHPEEVGIDPAVVGSWQADLTGLTYALWNYGPALCLFQFNADGTGSSDVYYTIEGVPLARESQTFCFTADKGKLVMEMPDGTWTYGYSVSGGKLTMDLDGNVDTFEKVSEEMARKYEEWSGMDLEKVPAPARYTVFVYGNAGGQMDKAIELGFWDQIQPLLKDRGNVRVVCLYKYGKDTSSKYADAGDVVWFELTDDFDLNTLREKGLQIRGYGDEAQSLKLYDPSMLRAFIEVSSLSCPAQEYIFAIWGHGTGFDPMYDVPGRNEEAAATRGVIADEWNNMEQLDMYQLSAALRESGLAGRLNTLFLHNCLMGNMETLTELRDLTDYICCSAHVLSSNGALLVEYIKGLMQDGNTEDAVARMLENAQPDWGNSYNVKRAEDKGPMNGDFKLLRASAFNDILDASKRLASRLVELYPLQTEAINRATNRVYRFRRQFDDPNMNYVTPFFDLLDYAHKLAEETGDTEMVAISQAMDQAFSNAVIHRADISWNEQHLDQYSLSVCLYHQLFYHFDFVGAGLPFASNIGEGYEKSSFHQLTGWGYFLRINQQNPTGNPVSEG